MATVFTMIIEGDLPGRFVWRDEICVAFLSIAPIQPGHTLVVPIAEVDNWVDLDDDTLAHLTKVSKTIAVAQQETFNPERVGMMIAGLEVPHVHLHVIPINGMHDLDFANADPNADGSALDRAAEALRAALGTTHLA
jgi:histidine triad (HIT) family protein